MSGFDKKIEVGEGSGNYVKLKDKESVTGIIRGEPHKFYERWENGRSTECPDTDPEGKFRFSVNFVVKEKSDLYVPKILKMGVMVFNQLVEIAREYDLNATAIKISRSGASAMDTEYTVMPLPPKSQPTEAALNHIKTIKLLELKPKIKPQSDDSPWSSHE